MGISLSLIERRSLVSIGLAAMSTTRALSSSSGPPVAKIEPRTVYFGKVEGEDRGGCSETLLNPAKEIIDPYFWLRDDERKNEEVLAHLREENAFTKSQTDHLEDFRKELYEEMLGHLQEDDESVPFADGSGYLYWWRTLKGSSYKQYWRSRAEKKECYLDVNKVAQSLKKPKMCDVSEVSASPQGTRIAYTLDSSGYETYELRILDADSGNIIHTIKDVAGGVSWADENTIYFTRHDKAHRPYQVYREHMHDKKEELIFQDDDNMFNVETYRDLDGTIFVISESKDTSEIHFIDDENNKLKLIRPREQGVEYTVASSQGFLYIVANADGQYNRAVYSASRKEPHNWNLLIPTSEHRSLSGSLLATRDFIVVTGREDGFARVWILETAASKEDQTILPDEKFMPQDVPPKKKSSQLQLRLVPPPSELVSTEAYYVRLDANAMYNTDTLRLCFSTMKLPKSIVDYNPKTNSHTVLKVDQIPNYDSDLYRTERLLVDSRDGRERIPLTLLWRPDIQVNGIHLYGYGSYSISLEPSFAASRLPLVDRGIVYAIAHVRGGGEMGKHRWYETQGKFKTKKNTFYDFVDCAKHIKQIVYPNKKISIEGRSAGGLLVGNACNLEPSLFEACLAGVPFVDLMVTMCDPSIPLTTEEWIEWGNPNLKEYFDYMLSYSPINNIVSGAHYPKVLIVSGLNDPRVAYWEPAKWTQLLRKHTANPPQDILLKMDMDSGHFSAADRYSYLRDTAFDYAWLLDTMLSAPSSAAHRSNGDSSSQRQK